MIKRQMSKEINDRGTQRGSCPECGFLIDTCMYFDKEDYRTLMCPSCKYEACNYGWYPKEFAKAKEEYQRSLK